MGMAAAEAQFHVLAVDDSIIDRKLIERLLKTSSYQVTTVDSGSKALEILGWHEDEELFDSPKNNQEVEVNLVITDYCMPGMTGYDLLKKIKESSFLRNIPVVIMSSENVPSRINRCLEEGAEEFFLKPVRLTDVHKLKPHMMKAKSKDNENKENQDDKDPSSSSSSSYSSGDEEEETRENETETTESQSQQTGESNNKNSKRKSMNEGPSPDRTRPRYNNGLTVMSN